MKEIKLEINIESFGAYDAKVKVNNRTYDVKLKDLGLEDAIPVAFTPTAPPMAQTVAAAPQSAPSSTGGGAPITAPMPGLILSIKVKVGDTVTDGQTLMVMEAMKMENNIDSTSGGSVKSITVKEGDNVSEGDVLITIG